MKIIKEGQTQPKTDPWPVGSMFTCCHCHCEFEIEKGDDFMEWTERVVGTSRPPYGQRQISVVCPKCRTALRFNRPRLKPA